MQTVIYAAISAPPFIQVGSLEICNFTELHRKGFERLFKAFDIKLAMVNANINASGVLIMN